MNRMLKLRTIACTGVIPLVAACSTLSHPPAPSRLPMQQPYRLLVVRPDVQVRELTADGTFSFRTDWTDTARAAVAEQLQRNLAARAGGSVEIVRSEATPIDPVLVAELHRRHEALGIAMPRPRTVGKSLGDAATELSHGTNSELMLVVHADFTVRTTGRKTIIGIGMIGCSLLEVGLFGSVGSCRNPDAGDESAFASLIDGATGEVLWTRVVTSGVGDPRDSAGAQKLARALTKRMPDLKPAQH
jgi:hypothetical protein